MTCAFQIIKTLRVPHGMRCLVPLFFGVFFLRMTVVAAAEEFLAYEGEARASIVIPSNASGQLHKSAEFLRDYIRRSSGAELEIRTEAGSGANLHLGNTELVGPTGRLPRDLAEDGFLLKRLDAKNFAIAGGSDWGTEFGVYEFLERFLGVRWLAPTELFTEVPVMKTIPLPEADLRIEPRFLSRELFPLVPQDDGADAQRALPPLWYSQADVWGRVNKLRAHVEFHHNLLETLPPSRFGTSHPEFYPMLNGQRMVPSDDQYYEWQPNFSAPGIVEVTAEEIIRYFDQYPYRSSYSLGVNDSKRFDESPESKARRSGKVNVLGLEDVSDDYYQWANEVADLVHKKHPGKYFGTLAYLQVLDPPSRVKLNPYIVPFITYELTRWEDPEFQKVIKNLTLAWADVATILGWYDYVYGSHYLIPRFFPHAEQQALSWGAAHKVKYYYAEALPNWGEGPNLWVLTKLLWNPDQDVDVLLDDWCAAAVGRQAAPKLREYYAIWEKFWSRDILSARWYSPVSLWQDFDNSMYVTEVPESSVKESEKLMNEVVALADTPRRKERAEALERMWKLYRASILARQGDDLWKTASLQTEAEALEYLALCRTAIAEAENRLRILGAMNHDPLHGHTIWRMSRARDNGRSWGCASLWPLVPWVSRSSEVRGFLENLAKKGNHDQPLGVRLVTGDQTEPLIHDAAKTASLVLSVGLGDSQQLLKNPSFEEGLKGWKAERLEVSRKNAEDGQVSLQYSGPGKAVLSQAIRYEPGTYYAQFSVFVPKRHQCGEIELKVTAYNDKGIQVGPHLPVRKATLKPGKWSTCILPFVLRKYNHPASTLLVSLWLEGFSTSDEVYLDNLGVYRCDGEVESYRGSGPDGE